jgi:shikimate kinase/3-dehydroquinate synthase
MAPMSDIVVLVGLSGSGKSTVGRCLGELLDRPFVDLDELIQRRTGRTPAQLIEHEGEPRFRQLEAEAIADAVARPGTILATGGGAILDPLNRWALWESGTVAWLDAADELLLSRVQGDAVVRPLLGGDAAGSLARLRREREPFYRAADLHADASASPDRVARELAERLAGRALTGGRLLFDAHVSRGHPLGVERARVVFGRDLGPVLLSDVIGHASTGVPLVVADERVAEALPGLLAVLPGERRILIRGGERAKRLGVAERLLERAATMGIERGDAWIAVGGGTIGDLVGTAASLYHRGAPLVHIPTTWLAQADSAHGGKVAVDLSAAKNAAGAFWPPVAVVSDVAPPRSRPRPRHLDGRAESLKSGLIGAPALWELSARRGRAAVDATRPDEPARYSMVERAARLKLAVVERDPYERGERRTLNLGHTLGHALEIESHYRLPHGQAVVLGLRAVAGIAEGRGAEQGLAARIDDLLSSLGYQMRRSFDGAIVREALLGDKKRHRGRQRWILPMAVGRVTEVDDVTESELDAALRRIAAPS